MNAYQHIIIHQGDITSACVDAIVNAANPYMLGGSGVDGAIHRVAGPDLLAACKSVEEIDGVRCPTGQARITEAGDLLSRYVIHTVGPIYANESNPSKLLTFAYKNSLKLALENQCTSIAFPAISCGVYGYPATEAASISLQICMQEEYSRLRVHFYLFGDEFYRLWCQELEKYVKREEVK